MHLSIAIFIFIIFIILFTLFAFLSKNMGHESDKTIKNLFLIYTLIYVVVVICLLYNEAINDNFLLFIPILLASIIFFLPSFIFPLVAFIVFKFLDTIQNQIRRAINKNNETKEEAGKDDLQQPIITRDENFLKSKRSRLRRR